MRGCMNSSTEQEKEQQETRRNKKQETSNKREALLRRMDWQARVGMKSLCHERIHGFVAFWVHFVCETFCDLK